METADVAVVGAGPAGVAAALAAAEAGLRTLLVDERAEAGGQVYRAPIPGLRSAPDTSEGDALRRALASSRVQHLAGHRVWTVSSDPLRLSVHGPSSVRAIQPRAVVVAAGATERVIPFPGWTLPGVMGLAATTILLKSQGVAPRAPTVVAGCGPLLAAVAAGILKAGGRVSAVVDVHGWGDWLRAIPTMLARPDLLTQGAAWALRVGRARVPILFRHHVVGVGGTEEVTAVHVAPRTGGSSRVIPARALAIGHGLVPSLDILALLGVERAFRPDAGGWVPVLDANGRTSLPQVYAAGDGTGIRGAAAATLAGRLAGLAAAYDLGAIDSATFETEAGVVQPRLTRARRFGTTMARLMTPPPSLVTAIPAETVICRCEDVTRREWDAALAAGARDLNAAKSRTRCGMGPCQGRMCAPAATALAALHPHLAVPVQPWTARPPLRPVAIGDLVGDFDYADIPDVKPAH